MTDKKLILATILDPQYKSSFLETEYEGSSLHDTVISWMKQELIAIKQSEKECQQVINPVSAESSHSDLSAEESEAQGTSHSTDNDDDFN